MAAIPILYPDQYVFGTIRHMSRYQVQMPLQSTHMWPVVYLDSALYSLHVRNLLYYVCNGKGERTGVGTIILSPRC